MFTLLPLALAALAIYAAVALLVLAAPIDLAALEAAHPTPLAPVTEDTALVAGYYGA